MDPSNMTVKLLLYWIFDIQTCLCTAYHFCSFDIEHWTLFVKRMSTCRYIDIGYGHSRRFVQWMSTYRSVQYPIFKKTTLIFDVETYVNIQYPILNYVILSLLQHYPSWKNGSCHCNFGHLLRTVIRKKGLTTINKLANANLSPTITEEKALGVKIGGLR